MDADFSPIPDPTVQMAEEHGKTAVADPASVSLTPADAELNNDITFTTTTSTLQTDADPCGRSFDEENPYGMVSP